VGINYETDITAESLKAAEAPKMLQDDRIDAFFYTVGHPNGAITEATSGRRKVRFIAVEGPGLDELIAKQPYYARAFIPVSLYPQAENAEDVPTFGVKATFVTSMDVSDDIVYAVTKEIFENLEEFKTLHPAYAVLTKENMLTGLSAPIHPGALKYYQEAGLDSLIPDELK
jgi:TRAP transporter TAXI family solute receptor